MPFIPVPGVLQAEMLYLWDSQIVENVLHYQPEMAIDNTVQLGLGLALQQWFDTHMQPLMPNTISLREVRITDLTSEFAPGASVAVVPPLVGALAGAESLPNNVSVSMSKRTALRGRSYRGRIYHCGLAESQVIANKLITAVQNDLLAAYQNLITLGTTGAEYYLVVVSKFQGGDPRVTGIATPVTGITTDGIIDSQRRRLPGRGS